MSPPPNRQPHVGAMIGRPTKMTGLKSERNSHSRVSVLHAGQNLTLASVPPYHIYLRLMLSGLASWPFSAGTWGLLDSILYSWFLMSAS